VDDGEAVEDPEHAVEERGEVGVGLELLHVLFLDDPPEDRPAQTQRTTATKRRPVAAHLIISTETATEPTTLLIDRDAGGLRRGQEEPERDHIA
jgi:hypothetical protein